MKSKKKTTEETIKVKGLFDHINHIREVKTPDYYNTLSDAEKTSFNKYMIVRFLSMDPDLVEAWLRHLSYGQFTKREMQQGTCWKIING